MDWHDIPKRCLMTANKKAWLVCAVWLSACGASSAPTEALLPPEMQAALGTYSLVSVDGKSPPPVLIGKFITATTGADVYVTGATVVLSAKNMTLPVDLQFKSFDNGVGNQTSTARAMMLANWTLNNGNLQLTESAGDIAVSDATIAGNALTLTATSSAFGWQRTIRLILRRT